MRGYVWQKWWELRMIGPDRQASMTWSDQVFEDADIFDLQNEDLIRFLINSNSWARELRITCRLRWRTKEMSRMRTIWSAPQSVPVGAYQCSIPKCVHVHHVRSPPLTEASPKISQSAILGIHTSNVIDWHFPEVILWGMKRIEMLVLLLDLVFEDAEFLVFRNLTENTSDKSPPKKKALQLMDRAWTS